MIVQFSSNLLLLPNPDYAARARPVALWPASFPGAAKMNERAGAGGRRGAGRTTHRPRAVVSLMDQWTPHYFRQMGAFLLFKLKARFECPSCDPVVLFGRELGENGNADRRISSCPHPQLWCVLILINLKRNSSLVFLIDFGTLDVVSFFLRPCLIQSVCAVICPTVNPKNMSVSDCELERRLN